MALVIKSTAKGQFGKSQSSNAGIPDQLIHVAVAGRALPQSGTSTTDQLFRVKAGRVLVRALIGQVTTVIQSSNPVIKISSTRLTDPGIAVGTAVDIASTVDISSLEVGGSVFVEGDGTALVKSNAGQVLMGTNTGMWIAPQGEIYITSGADKTGAIKWDMWYTPLDPGAFVEGVSVYTTII